jgi:hypothetical protein
VFYVGHEENVFDNQQCSYKMLRYPIKGWCDFVKQKVFYTALIALGFLCAGCSNKQQVKILSRTWAVGTHQDCIFAKQGLYCLPAAMKMFRQYNLEGFIDKGKNKLSRTDGIFILSVDIVHYLERNRAEEEKDATAEIGTVEASFSARSSDYSTWDCYKTGNGSPAIACHLTKEADSKTRDFNAKKEAAAKTDDTLLGLTAASLMNACSNPQATSAEQLYQVLKYPSARSGIPISLKFDNTFKGSSLLLGAETEEPRGADGRYPKEHISWARDYDFIYEAQKIEEQLPCINK